MKGNIKKVIILCLCFLSCYHLEKYQYGTYYRAPCWNADGTRIYYLRNDLTTKEITDWPVSKTWGHEKSESYICSCKPDGSDRRMVLKVGEVEGKYAIIEDCMDVSPDGEIIYSTSYYTEEIVSTLTALKNGIWVVKSDGENNHQILSWGRNPRWAYHYTKIIFEGDEEHPGIWLMDKDGSNVYQVLTEGSKPAFCDVNEKILYCKAGYIWVSSLKDSSSFQIMRGTQPDWTPDGERFVCWGNRIYNFADSSISEIPGTSNCLGYTSRWSESNIIVMGGSDVWVVNPDGTELKKILGYVSIYSE